ncbi:hypothetical protein [Nitrobacter sp. TKz-YC02]|uniref:hypothetical protein n=1 Tax=Nitrobacter sp. TKz-YC02 TaxID=3398704 RepID=UPI003CEBB580
MTAIASAAAIRKSPALRGLPVQPTKMPRLKSFTPIECPMCRRRTKTPEIDIVIEYYRVPPCEENVLRAVWKGKGRAVQTEQIFCAMYASDPDGGPSPDRMYRAFKALLHNLRVRLAGSGITIENVGYRAGYRLVIGEMVNG